MATYATLKADLQAFAENDAAEVQTNLDTICANAQRRVYRDLKVGAFNTQVSGVLAGGDPFLDVPCDLLSTHYIRVTAQDGTSRTLDMRDEGWLLEYWPDESQTGLPKYAALDEAAGCSSNTVRRWRLAPTPEVNVSYVVSYRRMPEIASANADTNWLFEHAYEVLLYAAMVELSGFVMDDRQQNLISLYEAKYQGAKGLVTGDDTTVRVAGFRDAEAGAR